MSFVLSLLFLPRQDRVKVAADYRALAHSCRGREGDDRYNWNVGEPSAVETSVTLQQPEMHRVFSQGKLSLDHGALEVMCCTASRGGCG